MDFGDAIKAMKEGLAVRRAGWNGKDMYVYLKNFPRNVVDPPYEPCIVMFAANKKYQPGWLASQPDMLAEDWELVATNATVGTRGDYIG